MMQAPELRRAALATGAMGYREAGEGPALLLMHGLNGSSRSFAAQHDQLAARYRVIAWDAPGYGGSEAIEPRADAYADAAAALLDALGVQRATVLGHSMGGVVAGRLVQRHAHRIERLVLSCTHWGLARPPGAELPARYAARLEERRSLADMEYGRERARRMLPADAAPEVAEAIAAIAREVREEGLARAIRMELDCDNRAALAKLEIPILLIDAERDPVLKPERAQALAALLPRARRVTLQGVGHAPYLEDPRAYNAALEAFLEDRCAARVP